MAVKKPLVLDSNGQIEQLQSTDSLSGTIPAGGTTGQKLAKIDATDYNTQWVDDSGGLTPRQVQRLISIRI
jgi:hypothetical protein